MKTKSEYIKQLQSCAGILRQRFGIRSLCIFGSVAREEQQETSDVDVCVEMEPKLYLFVELGMFLEDLLGCRVDVVRKHRNMNAFLKDEIERDGIYII
ncbi:MAG: nucleotidyltransferase family protein [Bacteroides intestinalis]|nr:nucleotidyltransferase family protein [Bacteroides intestinalis]